MDSIANVIGWIVGHSDELLAFAGAIMVPAGILANFTPTETDNKAVNMFGKIVNWLTLYMHNPDSKSVVKSDSEAK